MANTNRNIAGADKSKNLAHSFDSVTFFGITVNKGMWGTQMFGKVPILGAGGVVNYLKGTKTLQALAYTPRIGTPPLPNIVMYLRKP